MLSLIALLYAGLAAAAVAAPAPRTDQILIQGNKAGTQTVATEADGNVRSEYSYNDRGRGDHIIATWKLDAAGVPIEYTGTWQRLHEGRGRRDTSASPMARRRGRTAPNRASRRSRGEAFYVPPTRRRNSRPCWRARC